MKDENKIPYSEVFNAIEKILDMGNAQLKCSECGKGFFKLSFVDQDEPDLIIDDKGVYNCSDHLLYDLLVNPEITENLTIGTRKDRKAQLAVRYIDAQIFILKRNN